MKKLFMCLQPLCPFILLFTGFALAQNPVIRDQFTADPSARVFNGKVYLYASHDITPGNGKGRAGWFCMEDYHVFSTSNLTDWTDHGIIVSQDEVPWVNTKYYAMWAPDCMYRNGKYYFYFPAPVKDTSFGRGFGIGVAVSDKPYGPFVTEPSPMKNVHGIDPNVLIDEDGQIYLYWAARNIYVAKLKENMLQIEGEPQIVKGLPEKGLKEGPFVFKRNGIFYMIYPHVQDTTERLEYAISSNPMGPFKIKGTVMDAAIDCWTNQASVIDFNGQWYLFYHHNDLSPNFDKNRSVRIDSLFFNADGTIKKIKPTLRGVGVTDASAKIQIDRYSSKTNTGASVAFLDTLNKFDGWKTIFSAGNAWVQYNGVDFGKREFKSVNIRALSKTGGTLQIRLDKVDGPLIANVVIPQRKEWETITSPLSGTAKGVHAVIVLLKDNKNVEVDWIRFE